MLGQGQPARGVPVIKLRCVSCGKIADPAVVRELAHSGLGYQCPCGGTVVQASAPVWKGSALNRRSRTQEKKAAKRLGGRVQAGSGNQPGTKGDVRRQGEVRLECKLTTAKSYRLNLADLMKIEQAAYSGEKPALEIEFQGIHPTRRYVVLPGWVYDYYAGLAGDRS